MDRVENIEERKDEKLAVNVDTKRTPSFISAEDRYRRAVEVDLIKKAYRLVWGFGCALLVVFVTSLFLESDLAREVITILSSLITLVIGFLFGQTRKN